MFDVVIVGGGPAGMAAALTLGRVHRTTLLVDAGEGRNATADAVHNFLTRDGTPPAKLRALAREERAVYRTVRTRAATVTTVRVRTVDGFEVDLSDGGTARTRRLLLATGLADTLTGPRGVEALWGRSAFHCPYCHGYECTGERVAVLGAGPARVRLALQLGRFAADVVLCTDGEPLDPPARDTLESYGLAVRGEAVTRLEGTDGRLEQVVFESGPVLARDAVFVVNVPRQRSDLAVRLGCATFDDGCVEVDEFGRTDVPGVYAAGDMARRATVPIPLAAVVAAGVVDQDLLCADFGLPNPFARARG
ncbi:NAD(P)/FAD-dependent oxidoreductase [Streptosporangium saharense]|uniref:NAD(P)/FAD-dependent oxidoreductase n=1 Tax=Streptosporangium saharense TaxID=1706840 RepID=UPI003329B431